MTDVYADSDNIGLDLPFARAKALADPTWKSQQIESNNQWWNQFSIGT